MFKLTMPPIPISTSQVLFDVSRLLRSRNRTFATGVDRIDLEVALNLVRDFGQACHFLYAGTAGVAILPHDVGRELLETLDIRWNGGTPKNRTISNGSPSAINVALRARMKIGQKQVITNDTTYVVASHSGLGKVKGGLRRLDPFGRMKRFAYIHDIIPIEMPEYQRPDTLGNFRSYLQELTTARVTIASNSVDTDRRIRELASLQNWPVEDFLVLMPGLTYRAESLIPVRPKVSSYLSDARPFFTIIGTIEPRKNHLLLLNLWRQLVRELANPPRLCIIGKRGWENENVLDMLDRCEGIRGSVTEFSDLTDGEVQTMMQASTALLFPSFAEGLGIPLLEAAALKLRCIVSDIPVFREIAPAGTVFLDPLDGLGWKHAILKSAGVSAKDRI